MSATFEILTVRGSSSPLENTINQHKVWGGGVLRKGGGGSENLTGLFRIACQIWIEYFQRTLSKSECHEYFDEITVFGYIFLSKLRDART